MDEDATWTEEEKEGREVRGRREEAIWRREKFPECQDRQLLPRVLRIYKPHFKILHCTPCDTCQNMGNCWFLVTLTVLSIAQECHSTCYVCGPCRHTAHKLLSPEEVVQRQPLIETLPYPG